MRSSRPAGLETNPRNNIKSRLVLFVGTTPNIGTTTAAFCTAAELSRRTDQSIAYICLNLKSSKIHRYLGNAAPVLSVEDLRAEMQAKALTPARLKQCIHPVKGFANFGVIYGNRSREQAEFYHAEDIEHLLDTAEKTFDLCVVDVNAYWDNAATLCALCKADLKLVVTLPIPESFQEDLQGWLGQMAPQLQLDFDSFKLIVTQFGGNKVGVVDYGLKQIGHETGMAIAGKIKFFETMEILLRRGMLAEFLKQENGLERDLDTIVRSVGDTLPFSLQAAQPGKRWSLFRKAGDPVEAVR